MIRKVFVLKSVMVVMAVIAVSVGLLELNPLAAQETPTAIRSFSSDPVNAGDEVTVEITAEGHGSFGEVAESLPPGFTYLDSSLPADQVTKSGQTVSGETVTLSLLGAPSPTTFTYTVRASSVEGDHPFGGVFSGVDTAFEAFSGVKVGGDPSIEVAATTTPPATDDGDTGTTPPDAEGPSAARSFSEDPVNAGDEVTVEITAEGHGSFGEVVESLPPGFTYLDSSLPADQVTKSGQTVSGETVTLSLIGASSPTTFTYTVRASSVEGDHPFGGVFSGVDTAFEAFSGVKVGGDPSIEVEVGPLAGPNAKRSFSATSVAPRGRVTVTIIAEGHGSFGEVAETLPAGFTYLDSSLPGDQVTRSGQTVSGETVTLSLIGATSPTTFTYTVRASSGAGDDPFKGLFSGVDTAFEAFSGVKVGGTPSIPVRAATSPTKTPTPTTPTTGGSSSGSGSGSSGSGGGSAPAAATPTPTPTPTATATPPPTVVPTTPPATLVPTAVPDTPMPTAPVAIPVGPPGEEGEQGEPGAIGDLGPKGKPGTIGDPGPKGKPGTIGDPGPMGETGSAGPKGATGSAGETGARGDAGPVGEAGATGESGSGILGIVALILGIVAIVGVGGAFLLRRN